MKNMPEDKFKLWFFRDLSSDQRKKLFGVFGMPMDQLDTHGSQALALRHLFSAETVTSADCSGLLPCAICGLDADALGLSASRIRSCLLDKPEAVEGVAAGWKLVPVVPTQAMVDAGKQWTKPSYIYDAMLEFAPPAPALSVDPVSAGDAGDGWHDGAPEKPWANEWFIAETTWGDRVVLTALPEEWAYDFKTADDTYIKADKLKRWMQFPDSQYIAPAPADTDAAQSGGGSLNALIERLLKALEAAETYVIDGVTTAKQNLEMNAAYPARKPRYEAELKEARDIYAECQAARRAALAAAEDKP